MEKEKLMQISAKVAEFLKKHRATIIIAILIFLLGFGIRAHLMKYELFFEFDTYYHARITQYILTGFLPETDPLGYYWVEGGQPIPQSGKLFWMLSALFYKLFTFNAPFDKDTLIMFVKFLPALYGALISVAMYFLGNEAYGKRAGVITGFIAATMPAFVYRTMAGQYEDDALGFLWMVIGFYFVIKATKNSEMKKQNMIYAALGGLFFSIMAFTWEMFLLIPIIMIAHLIWTSAAMWFVNADKKKLADFAKLTVLALVVFATITTAGQGTLWMERVSNLVVSYVPVSAENLQRIEAPPTEGNVLAATVGEENTGRQFFGTKYNIMIFLAILSLFVIPYKFLKKNVDTYSLIFFFWILITYYMAWGKLKFTYVFGLPIAIAGGIVINETFKYLQKRSTLEKSILSIPIAIMLLASIAGGIYFVSLNVPTIELNPSWKEALPWMKENLPDNAKIFNWWDEGHWITFLAEKKVLLDNRNARVDADYEFARAVLATDENTAYEIVKKFDADYVLLSSDLLSKHQPMGLYAYQTINRNDPRLTKYFSFVLPCNVTTQNNAIVYNCNQNILTEPQMNMLPTTWTNKPNQLQEGRLPLFIYRNSLNTNLFVNNEEANNAFMTKLWFDSSEITKFEKVYENRDIKIYKVK